MVLERGHDDNHQIFRYTIFKKNTIDFFNHQKNGYSRVRVFNKVRCHSQRFGFHHQPRFRLLELNHPPNQGGQELAEGR
jgi:hypothetical protein